MQIEKVRECPKGIPSIITRVGSCQRHVPLPWKQSEACFIVH
jgi:hypothetical protein